MSTMGGQLDPEPVLRLLRGPGMLNKILMALCKAEGLPSSGVKQDLQLRIAGNLKLYAMTGNITKFNELRAMIENPNQVLQTGRQGFSSSPAAPSPHAVSNGFRYGTAMPPVNNVGYRAPGHADIQFKMSPFYVIRGRLGNTTTCEREKDCLHFQGPEKADTAQAMAQHRHTVDLKLSVAQHPVLEDMQNDKSLRIMVFCAGDNSQHPQDIAFPHQSELKVNGGDVKANLRGLKNKPGSTRPVDISDYLRLRPSTYSNSIQMTYALTTKKFYLSLWIVKATPVADLVKRLEGGQRISKESVLKEMVAKAQDPDIEATSMVLSLKCPLSTLRIDLPCRSVMCRHNQCFDATSYLQLQEQGPTWLCPICNNPAPFDRLVVDEYLKDILKNTSRSLDQVTVEPDGRWTTSAKVEPQRNGRSAMSFGSDDDDDLIEISDRGVPRPGSTINSTPQPHLSGAGTPDSLHTDPSSVQRRQSSKRPIAEVVDLTLSDDDEEPYPRPVKRQLTGNAIAYTLPQSMGHGSGSNNGFDSMNGMNGMNGMNDSNHFL